MSIPKTIYLQWYGDSAPHDEPLGDQATWCEDQIWEHDLNYRLVDPNQPNPLEAVRAEIEQESTQYYDSVFIAGMERALEIIDKYIEA